MQQITLKEMLSIVQQLPNKKLPSPVFKGEVVRGKQHAPQGTDHQQFLEQGQIKAHFVQCNCNDKRSDWLPANSIMIVQDEIKSIHRNGNKLIITLE